jgi:hypothetical protein
MHIKCNRMLKYGIGDRATFQNNGNYSILTKLITQGDFIAKVLFSIT